LSLNPTPDFLQPFFGGLSGALGLFGFFRYLCDLGLFKLSK
jgi:hypothetical protein